MQAVTAKGEAWVSEKGGGQGREYPGKEGREEASTCCCLAPKEVSRDKCMQHTAGRKA